ncbi:hypothetical protein NC653_021179 [Populus alba x Populus x berolinensis]|uniref:Uncharacterized protein n=1 Tax=Populus alba x Populus x berolinensis TaxID=444605 RepID=A0AAD6MM92_9ROSI|nr:hypothetical protein NC653_021179 [Populus alba x Populus x berolinensis]
MPCHSWEAVAPGAVRRVTVAGTASRGIVGRLQQTGLSSPCVVNCTSSYSCAHLGAR